MKRNRSLFLFLIASLFLVGLATLAPIHAQRTASNPFGAQLNVQDAGTCSTTNSFAWQTLPTNAGTTTLNLSGTWTATVTVRESNNGGGSWTTAPTNGTLTTNGTTTYPTNGFTDFCADVTAFTSGIVQVSITTGLQQVIPGSSALAGTTGNFLFNNNGVFGASGSISFDGVTNDPIGFNASNTISANPASIAAANTGWKFCTFQNLFCNGIAANTKVESSTTWWSLFVNGTNPANNASSTVPDTNAKLSLGTTGQIFMSNCTSSASPAVCAGAANGSVTIAAAATTEQVNTTAVTANSVIILTEDDSLGTKLGVTCNTTSLGATKISARTSGSNFTITTASAPVTNPACLSYLILN